MEDYQKAIEFIVNAGGSIGVFKALEFFYQNYFSKKSLKQADDITVRQELWARLKVLEDRIDHQQLTHSQTIREYEVTIAGLSKTIHEQASRIVILEADIKDLLADKLKV